jgi:osmotically-inducible protein OsmY
MTGLRKVRLTMLVLVFSATAQAQTPSTAASDQETSQKISAALEKAGIDPRTTSVQVIVTADHTVYLKGLISDRETIKHAGEVAAKTAPSYKIVNNIRSSFFDDPNHVTGDKTK